LEKGSTQVYKNRLFTALPGLRRMRTERGLSLRELHDRTGISFANISNIENGIQRASMASFTKLAIALEVENLAELLLSDDEIERCEAKEEGELLVT
jgi:transcriptional regulator with XRE-family HTH domain